MVNTTVAILLLSVPCLLAAQEWPAYAGDAGGSKYSRLKQVNRENVTRLKVAWTYHTGDVSDGSQYPPRSAFEATPLVIDGVLYVTTPFNRLIALEAETGKRLWDFIRVQISCLSNFATLQTLGRTQL